MLDELTDQLELVAVVDPHAERAQQIVDAYGGKPYSSLAEALTSTAIDLVSVCTPTGSHGVLTIEALEDSELVLVDALA